MLSCHLRYAPLELRFEAVHAFDAHGSINTYSSDNKRLEIEAGFNVQTQDSIDAFRAKDLRLRTNQGTSLPIAPKILPIAPNKNNHKKNPFPLFCTKAEIFSPECVDAILRLDVESCLDLQSLIVTVVGVYTAMRVKDMHCLET